MAGLSTGVKHLLAGIDVPEILMRDDGLSGPVFKASV